MLSWVSTLITGKPRTDILENLPTSDGTLDQEDRINEAIRKLNKEKQTIKVIKNRKRQEEKKLKEQEARKRQEEKAEKVTKEQERMAIDGDIQQLQIKYAEIDSTSPMRFDKKDPYDWLTFLEVLKTRQFATEFELREFICKNSRRCVAILKNTTLICKTGNDELSSNSVNLRNSSLPIVQLQDGTQIKTKNLLEMHCRRIESVVNEPLLESAPRNLHTLNIYPGIKAQILENQDSESLAKTVKPLTDFLSEVWCQNDELTYNYLMKWLQVALTDNRKKTESMLFVCSEEHSTGKTIICNFFSEFLFGPKISNKLCGSPKLMAASACPDYGQRLLIIDGYGGSTKYLSETYRHLKRKINDDTMSVNAKYLNAKKAPNFCNYIILSNNLASLPVTEHDQKVIAIKVSSAKKDDVPFFRYLVQIIMNQSFGDAFYTYLMSLDLSEVDLCVPLRNNFFNEMKEISQNSAEDFKRMIAREFPIKLDFNGICLDRTLSKLNSHISLDHIMYYRELFAKYSDYCKETNKISIGDKKFSAWAKDHIQSRMIKSYRQFNLSVID